MKNKITPKIAIASMALPGYFLKDEECAEKNAEFVSFIKTQGYEVCANECVYSSNEAYIAGKKFVILDIDFIVVLVTTFVADYFLTELTKSCKKPVFIWALERDVNCITLVCTPLIAASLKNLKRDCCIVSGEINDKYSLDRLDEYAKAAMLKNRLFGARIGYSGNKPEIMYSMAANEYILDEKLGITIDNVPIEDFYSIAHSIDESIVSKKWELIKSQVGFVDSDDVSGLLSVRYYLAAKQQVDKGKWIAYSINCFPNLKAKICLGIAMLNDELIGAGCEGDIHSSILMAMGSMITRKASFNGDFLHILRKENAITFSHCGAGALSLASAKCNISLKQSQETGNGLGVFYKTFMPGKVTLVNLMNTVDGLRLVVICSKTVQDTSCYEGNPLTIEWFEDVKKAPDTLAQIGCGHHFTGYHGDFVEVLRLFARMTNIEFVVVGQT